MKTIHPTYYHDAKVTCACGNTFFTGSYLKEIRVDICSACHPFFTGEMRFVDTQGRVEKFQAKRAQAAKVGKTNKKKIKADRVEETPKSLKEMLQQATKVKPTLTKTKSDSPKTKN